MPLDGRINVDVLFHDTDGTTSLKVVSLEDSKAYTSGKVAIVTGTVGTTAVPLWTASGEGLANQYRNAAGQQIGAFTPNRIALRASGQSGTVIVDDDLFGQIALSVNNELSVASNSGTSGSIACLSGTASYTVVLYGT